MKISNKILGEIADVIAGQSPPSNIYNRNGEGLPFYQGKADFGDKYPITRNWCIGKGYKEAIENDILLSVRAPVGPVNLCNTKSIIGRGLSAIRVKSGYYYEYVYYYLKNNESKISKLGTGSIFKAITQKQINNIIIPIPENYDDQVRISTILSRLEALIAKREESIKALDELLKSTFLEMFGDPVKNERGWDKKALKEFGKISTGNTPPRNDEENYSANFIEWIKTDNIVENRTYLTEAVEYLSEKGLEKSRTVKSGALLVACIAGSIDSIGRAAIANREVSFNQQINAIEPNEKINTLFLYWLFKISRLHIQSYAAKGMKKILTKGVFENITMVRPTLSLQNQFVSIVERVEAIKAKYYASFTELENLYGSLSQRAFNGKLDLSRIPVDVEINAEPAKVGMEIPGPKWEVDNKFSQDKLKGIVKKQLKHSFSFNDLWRALQENNLEEPPVYEEVKKMVFDFLGSSKPFLSQKFDDKTKDNEGKTLREIVLRVNL